MNLRGSPSLNDTLPFSVCKSGREREEGEEGGKKEGREGEWREGEREGGREEKRKER